MRSRLTTLALLLSVLSACSSTGGKQEEPIPITTPSRGGDGGEEPRPGSVPTRSSVGEEPRPGPVTTRSPSVDDLASSALRTAEGKLEYIVPSSMRVGETRIVQARISRSIDESLTKDLAESDIIIKKKIEVADHMTVRLSGAAFSITPITPEEQVLTGSGFTQWQWDVIPERGGKQTLIFTVTLVFLESNRPSYLTREVDREEIEIEVNYSYQAKQFVGNNWQWLWTVVAIPLGTFLISRISRVRKRKQDSSRFEPD
jgi:hypothetical protein